MMKLYWICLALTVLAAVEGSSPSSSALDSVEGWTLKYVTEDKPLAKTKKEMPRNEPLECGVSERLTLAKLGAASRPNYAPRMIAIPMSGELSFDAVFPGPDDTEYFEIYKAALDTDYFKTYKAALASVKPKVMAEASRPSPLLVYPALLHEAKEVLPKVVDELLHAEDKDCYLDMLAKWVRALTKAGRPLGDFDELLRQARDDLSDSRYTDFGKRYAAAMTALDVIIPWWFKIIELKMQYKVVSELLQRVENVSGEIVRDAEVNAKNFGKILVQAEQALAPRFDVIKGQLGDVDRVDVLVEVENCRKSCVEAANLLLSFVGILVDSFRDFNNMGKVIESLKDFEANQRINKSGDLPKDSDRTRGSQRPSGGRYEVEFIAFAIKAVLHDPSKQLSPSKQLRPCKKLSPLTSLISESYLNVFEVMWPESYGTVFTQMPLVIVFALLMDCKSQVEAEVQRELRGHLVAFGNLEGAVDRNIDTFESQQVGHFAKTFTAKKRYRTGKKKLKAKKKGRHVHKR